MRPIYELNDAIVDNDGPALIRALMKNPNIKQNDLDECFARAMPRASGSIIKILIERGAQLNSKSYRLAMTRTRCEGSTIINILRDYGFDIDTAEFGRTPVHHLLTSPAILIWLLDQGANPNTMAGHAPGGNHPFSPLCEAAEHMYPFALLILLGKGAALDPEAIFYAIGSANNGTATLQTLIEYGADVNYVHKIWGTPLLHCIRTKQMEKLRVLFETGADLVMKDARGRRILEFADVEFANIHKMIVEGELDEYLGFRDLLKEHLDGKEKGLY